MKPEAYQSAESVSQGELRRHGRSQERGYWQFNPATSLCNSYERNWHLAQLRTRFRYHAEENREVIRQLTLLQALFGHQVLNFKQNTAFSKVPRTRAKKIADHNIYALKQQAKTDRTLKKNPSHLPQEWKRVGWRYHTRTVVSYEENQVPALTG